MKSLGVVILAAGLGKRMRSKKAKVLHPLRGKPIILYLIEKALSLKPEILVVVVGHQGDAVKDLIRGSGAKIVRQEQQLGTGHAVLQAERVLKRFQGDLLILNGDTPLLGVATLQKFLKHHRQSKATLSLLTAIFHRPEGYGRVVRKANKEISQVVEEKDATVSERKILEINAGIYLVEPTFLFSAIKGVKRNNAQKEYYLTDMVKSACENKRKVSGWVVDQPEEVLGVNSRIDFSVAERFIRRKVLERIMEQGVSVLDPSNTYVDEQVVIGRDSVLYPSTFLEGKTRIGKGCIIGPQAHISDSTLGNGVVILNGCVVRESSIEDEVSVGPYAHLRPGTVLRKGARIGNFVEVKKSVIGKGSKANHLTYLGDAVIGGGVNIGAGTIICNYDGKNKAQTIIEDGVFVGSSTQLIAPVRVGRKAVVAAGSTITRDVPPESLAISRVPQENKEGWVKGKKASSNKRSKKTSKKGKKG